MPNNLRPILADHALVCPHGKNRVFDMDMATERFGDLFTRVDCPACAQVASGLASSRQCVTWLTNFSKEQREDMNRIMTFWDELLNGAQKMQVLSILETALGVADAPTEIKILVFIEPYFEPLVEMVSVADRSQFLFRDSALFELSNAGGTSPTLYERYELPADVFTADSGVLDTADISKQGNTLIYRRVGISDWECPGLFNLRTDLQERHYGRDGTPAKENDELVRAIFEDMYDEE
ncbi:hypothetical protein B0H13DRAFT_1880047 [Mycena leptocephala]|nr:hypothetical protein B0H13DRAFT_1880047 [Mycena leptocephala]